MIKLNERIDLPKLEVAYCDGYYVYCNPLNGKWFVTTKKGSKVIDLLYEKGSLGAILETISNDNTYELKSQDAIKTVSLLDAKDMLAGDAVRDELVKEEYPSYLHIHLTNYCNYSCRHCYISANLNVDTSKELSYEELEDCIKQYLDFPRKIKECYINFSGGEATKSDKFIGLLKFSQDYAMKKGLICHAYLITNGSTFTDVNFVNQIKQYIERVHISVDGCTEEVFDYIRGQGNYRKTISGINNAVEQGMNVAINVTLVKNNVEDFNNHFEHLLAQLSNADSISFVVSKAFVTGRASENMILDDDQFFKAKANIFRKLDGNRADRKKKEPVRESCGFGGAIVLYPNGDIKYCVPDNQIYYDCNAGNVHENSLTEIVNTNIKNLLLRTSVDQLAGCQKCPVKYICGGGCRLKHLYFNHSADNVYCEGEIRRRNYRETVRILILEYILQEDDIENDFSDPRFIELSSGWILTKERITMLSFLERQQDLSIEQNTVKK